MTCKVEQVGHHDGTLVPIVNVMHASCGSGPSVSDLDNIAGAFSAAWTSNKTTFPSNYHLDYIRVTDLNSAIGPQVTDTSAEADGGGDQMSGPQMAGIVKLLTIFRGRSYRGRIYLPVPGDAVQLPSPTITSVHQGRMGDWIADVIGNLTALSPVRDLMVASKKLEQSQAVVSVVIEPLVATQRRRVGR